MFERRFRVISNTYRTFDFVPSLVGGRYDALTLMQHQFGGRTHSKM
jgi:hypothetical protein